MHMQKTGFIEKARSLFMQMGNLRDQSSWNIMIAGCVNEVGPKEDVVKALFAYGLRLTSRYMFSETDDHGNGQIWE